MFRVRCARVGQKRAVGAVVLAAARERKEFAQPVQQEQRACVVDMDLRAVVVVDAAGAAAFVENQRVHWIAFVVRTKAALMV